MFGVTCWWLNRWRNALYFERDTQILVDQIAFLFTRVEEIERAMQGHSLINCGGKRKGEERFIRWEYPREHGFA